MNVSDFIEEADIAEAPEYGPDAFAFLVARAQRRLTDNLREISDDRDHWEEINSAKYSFMNVVTALAKSY